MTKETPEIFFRHIRQTNGSLPVFVPPPPGFVLVQLLALLVLIFVCMCVFVWRAHRVRRWMGCTMRV